MTTKDLAILPREPIAKLADLSAKMEALHNAPVNLVTPLASIDFIPPMKAVSLRAAAIRTDDNSPDVYKDRQFCSDQERALTKVGILKVWAAAGGSVLSSCRTDDGSNPLLCSWSVMLRLRGIDGNVSDWPGSKTIDLREGSPLATKMTARQLPMAQMHIDSMAETKALLRAVRAALALPQKFTVADLKKPFVVPCLVDAPDMNDPEQRHAYIQKQIGATAALYGSPQHTVIEATPVPEGVDPATGEVVDDEGSDFELPPPAAAKPNGPVCECPCGHNVAVDPGRADHFQKQYQTVRCPQCSPNTKFDFESHAHLSDLAFPGRPDVTVELVRSIVAKSEVPL